MTRPTSVMDAPAERVLLRVPEAVYRYGIGRSKLYELIQAGEIPAVHIGRSVRIPAAAMDAWVERLVSQAGRDSDRGN